MGKNNRQRRADKHRQRARWAGPGSGSGASYAGPATGSPDSRDLVEMILFDAARAAELGIKEELDATVAGLTERAATNPRFGATIAMVMTGCLVPALRAAWEGGWQPADIVQAAGKRLGRGLVDVTCAVIAAEASTSAGPGVAVPESWAEQLRQVSAATCPPLRWTDSEELRCGVRLLGMLSYLPVLPRLVAPPSQWGHGRPRVTNAQPTNAVDGRMLAKVRALLAKAESTNFEEEANSLTAKAQELMARYAIDQAMVADRDGGPGEEPCGRRVGIDDPYPQGKANLLSAVARANRCRTVWADSYGFSTVFGFAGDIDIVEVLYTSLLVQATRAMTAAGSVRDESGRSRTRSFRQSFLISFARRIGERLQAATTQATVEAEVVHGGALLPVLAGRAEVVERAFATVFPHLVSKGARVTNYDGWVAGRLAADQAHLGPEHQVLPGIAV